MRAIRRLVLALCLSLTLVVATPAQDAAPPSPEWVQRSNEHAQVLLQAQAPFQPEFASFFGIPGFDEQVSDLRPGFAGRFREANAAARAELQRRLASEEDPNVRQDLEIMIRAADEAIDGSALNERMVLPWIDAPQLVFQGIRGLLQESTPAERRAHALERLRRYAGMTPDTEPLVQLARARYEERVADAALLRPTRAEVEQAIGNVPAFVAGIRQMFGQFEIEGAEPALDRIEQQLTDWAEWTGAEVLPAARTDTRQPPELYAFQLRQFGIDIAPTELLRRAQLEFMETRAAMQMLAPLVANAEGIEATDYREVIRAIKAGQLPRGEIEPVYRDVMAQLDVLIERHDVVDLPNRPMQMRIGTEAEAAAQPAPHFLPGPLIGNTGQQGTFVLPLGNPDTAGEGESYDDFSFDAVAWTLTAHEGRPGHELQFTAMVERGVSLARTLFAFNSVNVEGWALYAEAEMVPYEPIDGQLFALQFRLLRAARAMLDPMLNLGMIDRERARVLLEQDVVLSPAMARQELDRYTFRAPGQAGSYFYGYARILELRMETELALGEEFDREAFNNFLLDQGLLPPDLLAKAVRERFVPARKAQ